MIRHAAEVFLLLLSAFALGTLVGIGLRVWWSRRLARPAQAIPIPVAVPVAAAPAPERRRIVGAPAKAAPAAAVASATPSAARALVPVKQRPQPLAKLPSPGLRSGWPTPASLDGRRLFQAHLKAATERRDQQPAGSRPAAPPGTALARPTNGRLREIDLTAIRRQPQRTLPPPQATSKGTSLPIIVPSVRADDVWNDELPRSLHLLQGSKPELRALTQADDPWDTPAGRQTEIPPRSPRPTPMTRQPAPLQTSSVPKANGGHRQQEGKLPRRPGAVELPAIAAPRSDEIWIEAARADAGLPPSNGSAPVVRGAYRTDGKRPLGLDATPAAHDNLRRIRGVGQGFEKRLNELGIYKFAQVAAWTEAEQQWVSDQLGFPGRVERDDWPGQATRLLQRRRPEAALAVDAEIAGDP